MKRRSEQMSFGCFYSLWLGIVCVVLLILNFELVKAALSLLPQTEEFAKTAQLLQFAGPVAMIFIEFWIYDLISDRADGQGQEMNASETNPRS